MLVGMVWLLGEVVGVVFLVGVFWVLNMFDVVFIKFLNFVFLVFVVVGGVVWLIFVLVNFWVFLKKFIYILIKFWLGFDYLNRNLVS